MGQGLWCLALPFRFLGRRCRGCCGCGGRRRKVHDASGQRELDSDSESEAELGDKPCQAHRVGVQTAAGQMRPLATLPCRDEAKEEGVRLLLEDQRVSDVVPASDGPTCVPLCVHHSQLYNATLHGRKCSHLTCFRAVQGATGGVPLCGSHLLGSPMKIEEEGEGGEPLTPHRAHLRRRTQARVKTEEGLHSSPGTLPPQNAASDPSGAVAPAARLSATGDHARQMLKVGQDVLVRIHLTTPQGLKRWTLFHGQLQTGFDTNAERYYIFLPLVRLAISIPRRQLRHTVNDGNKDDGDNLVEWLTQVPRSGQGQGMPAYAQLLDAEAVESKGAWDGCYIGGDGDALSTSELEAIAQQPEMHLTPHEGCSPCR